MGEKVQVWHNLVVDKDEVDSVYTIDAKNWSGGCHRKRKDDVLLVMKMKNGNNFVRSCGSHGWSSEEKWAWAERQLKFTADLLSGKEVWNTHES